MSESIERDLVDEIFAGSEAWENMQILADDIGSRLAGSAGEVEARDFLAATLKRYGMDEVARRTLQAPSLARWFRIAARDCSGRARDRLSVRRAFALG
ncbi:MAG: hypothetical protein ACI906_005362 [Candidatus Latescibacterota bacterium]|jgi:hypothetical protein